jgi:hypothetical protein
MRSVAYCGNRCGDAGCEAVGVTVPAHHPLTLDLIDGSTKTIAAVPPSSLAFDPAFLHEGLEISKGRLAAATKFELDVLRTQPMPARALAQNPVSPRIGITLIREIANIRIRDIKDTIRDIKDTIRDIGDTIRDIDSTTFAVVSLIIHVTDACTVLDS